MESSFQSANTSRRSGGVFSASPYTPVEIILIVAVAGSLSLITATGNILVMLSIKVWACPRPSCGWTSTSSLTPSLHVVSPKVNRNLQTVNNYFLFSLACADLIIGLCSMNLYTVYIVIGYWPLGAVVCDLWLAVDYVVSNASVMNLLIISFDRYFCVTKPLSYPVRRSTKMAGLMIAAAWVLSFILWAPAILFWQFIVGGRTVPPDQCYIQFFSNPAVTFGTAIAAFYLPVAIMIYLYWRISKASRSRVKRDSRKTSGTSLGDGPDHSQEDRCESRNNTGRHTPLEAGGKEEAEQQQNGSGPCNNASTDQGDSTRDSIHPSTSEDTTVTVASQKGSDAGTKTAPTHPPSPGNSAADRQSLMTRTLFKVKPTSTSCPQAASRAGA